MSSVGQASGGAQPALPAPGEVIAAKYEVESVLGAGGMGVVLCARHLQLGQRVALKFMRGEAAHEQSAVSRFLREARAAVALSSEHVAKVLDVGTLDTGEPYMVMEYLDGVDLGRVLRTSGPLSVGEAVGTLLQACEAIAEAHMLGIVHRDLKPSNLFRTARRDGSQLIKVLDFGISKTVAINSPGKVEDLTASGLLMGSPGYMSPEQVRSAKAVDTRSDLWSLGVILYEFLVGEAPFTGETLGETFARILSEPPPPISPRRPDVPDGVAAVILRCLERDVERRTQSVGQLAAQLAPFAPKSAGPSIERIARMCAAGGQGAAVNADSPSDTMTAGLASRSKGADSARRDRFIETGPAWLRSGSIPPRRRTTWRVAAVAASSVIVIAVLAISLGIYSLRQPSAPAPAQSFVSTSTTPPAGTAKSPEEPATLTPPPNAQTEPDIVVAAPDAGRLLPQRSNLPQAPARSETRRASPGHPPAVGSADPSLENLLEQRR